MAGSLRRRGALLLAAALCAAAGARADTQALSCTESPSSGTAWACENFGTVAAGANTTFLLAVQPSDAQYSRFDVNVTLTSLSGDADLCGPLRPVLHPPQVAAHAGQGGPAPAGSLLGSCTQLLLAARRGAALGARTAGSEHHILDLRNTRCAHTRSKRARRTRRSHCCAFQAGVRASCSR